ncbi:MAG: sigma-54-dependent Fis family transcriptional regulator [Planctomycetes bacterium]|nr:sigma-54-dependent Fis family transcriptional regulator [Planctomycetota bacterium]
MTTILLADDDTSINAGLAERLRARGYEVLQAYSGKQAVQLAQDHSPQIALLDLAMPEGDGLFVLERLEPDVIAIMITAHGTVDIAVKAMRQGAYDFIQKPFEPALIEQTLARAVGRLRLERQREAWETQQPLLRADDPVMDRILGTARKAAAGEVSVLILGESGVGKEVLAQQIHRWSPRAKGPFVPINCTALAETLLESELFGHEKGAFTGASARRRGKIELADGGTLFLDEIGDTSLTFQAKLLRVLQEKTFERVGGEKTLTVDVRYLAATNKDLRAKIAAGTFREDLYYRLNVVSLTVPPLRERRAEIPSLAKRFLEERELSSEALEALLAYPWPGNIRELRNVLERAKVLSEGDLITPVDLPPELLETVEGAPDAGYHARVRAAQRRILEEALTLSEGNQTRAAEALGLQRSYLARLIKKLDVKGR